MSRYYEMTVRIEKFDEKKKQKLKDKADEVWGFIDWIEDKDYMQSTMQNNLVGGESEEELEVTATYLEELPFDTYFFDPVDYDKFMKAKEAVALK